MVGNLDLTLMTENQNSKFETMNDIAAEIESALCDEITTHDGASSIVVTATEFEENYHHVIGGTSVADFNFTVPATDRPFLVTNSSVHVATVKQASGTTVDVPAGDTYALYSGAAGIYSAGGGGGGSGTESMTIAVGDEVTAATVGTGKITFRMPYGFTLTDIRASVTTAPTGSVLTVDVNEAGGSILSTKLTIDATEKTSVTAAAAAVISDSALADDAEMTIDIDTIGSTIAGAGLKVTLIGVQT